MLTKSVAVITSTIGRPELERAIQSVQQQTYPCQHYVFVDGVQFAEQAKQILDKYPQVIVTYLPMNTGANGWSNSSINAIAPFLAKEDMICYLDDDNWYEPNHVETCLTCLMQNQLDYVYSYRNLINSVNNHFICRDTFESVGPNKALKLDISSNMLNIAGSIQLHNENHIDTNTYFLTRKVALEASQYWYSGRSNDNNVSNWLLFSAYKGICTKTYSVNYLFDPTTFFNTFYQMICQNTPLNSSEQDKIAILEALIRAISDSQASD
ncbi:glycosyltransferase [[Haemophilus] ducreyi]|uniref:Glycosyltransferase n=1 Tax=Haemophilus ducreyi (strain 35000HP / ATCC 700724) TaxID=233412 RepID=Q7VNV3_HAEDU|nr:glycosyltransferase family A protein [[Haemophilus] ducreyi]AAP95345.1 putative glycosyltransferase [[Haemophilus] ducreyi 35000HP]ANF61181.1 glycosyltransferase [[Haemophilus] ducreyi]ANF63092.1 glycosyltransferase [[Haemophilus] ducreyi]ANF65296.1 glycosyltransferase [[Haemophilus] ducreyi]ANF66174.1 glycosyltransferase [[Haemophilus] ducreyi]